MSERWLENFSARSSLLLAHVLSVFLITFHREQLVFSCAKLVSIEIEEIEFDLYICTNLFDLFEKPCLTRMVEYAQDSLFHSLA